VVLKKQLKEFLSALDHVCLNDLPYFQEVNPTTENIAKYVYWNFPETIAPLQVKSVEVWESDNSSVNPMSARPAPMTSRVDPTIFAFALTTSEATLTTSRLTPTTLALHRRHHALH